MKSGNQPAWRFTWQDDDLLTLQSSIAHYCR